MFCILNMLFYHPVCEATPDSKITGAYCTVRVSFQTSFDLKQPKLERKLVSALSETKRLFRLINRNKPKQTEMKAI